MSSYRGVVVRRAECTIEDGYAGYLCQPSDTAVEGVYQGEFTVGYPDGGIETDPENGYLQITIERALAFSPLPPPVTGIAPVNTLRPVLEGDTLDGQTLTGNEGVWTGNPAPVLSAVIQRQLGEDGAIEVAAQVLSVVAVAGWRYRVRISASNGVGGAVEAVSDWSEIVRALPIDPPDPPSVWEIQTAPGALTILSMPTLTVPVWRAGQGSITLTGDSQA